MTDRRAIDPGTASPRRSERADATIETDADTPSDRTDGGTYTLLVALPAPVVAEVGALGICEFDPGWYAYTGSALGPGGFARVERHRDIAAGRRDTRHWHVDYLLGHPETAVDTVVRTPDADVECAVSRHVDGVRVPAFGASDCDCPSHLVYGPDRGTLLSSIERAHAKHS